MNDKPKSRVLRAVESLKWICFLWTAPTTIWKIIIGLAVASGATMSWISGYGHPQILVLAAIGAFFLICTLTGVTTRRYRLSPVANREFFVGQWLVPSTQRCEFHNVIELRTDGTAQKRRKHGPIMKDGHWTYSQGEIDIAWNENRPVDRINSSEMMKPCGSSAVYGTCVGEWRPTSWIAARRISQDAGALCNSSPSASGPT
jgi:hypothetical protein